MKTKLQLFSHHKHGIATCDVDFITGPRGFLMPTRVIDRAPPHLELEIGKVMQWYTKEEMSKMIEDSVLPVEAAEPTKKPRRARKPEPEVEIPPGGDKRFA